MDMDDKVKGVDLRGKNYTVSQDGLCPRCGNSNRLYVILDKYVSRLNVLNSRIQYIFLTHLQCSYKSDFISDCFLWVICLKFSTP